LAKAEQSRARRFLSPVDRDRFVARRVFYRRVLGERLGLPPAAVEFHVTAHGRPYLDPAWGVEFSTSHDVGVAVIAVTTGIRVGVDVERVRELDGALDVAASTMTEREISWLRSMPPESLSRGFLELWTRKEAVVKGLGVGLSMPLAGFDCATVDATGLGQPTSIPGATWSFRAIDGIAGYVGYVASEAPDVSIRLMGELEAAA
jgi:4'-phosphopantetheinyl transferase